jgi:hypothetical protein
MAPTLEYVFSMKFTLSKEHTLFIGPTRGNGKRLAAPIVGGYLQGEDFRADLVPGGSDWPRINDAAGVGYIDGRGQFRDSTTGDIFYFEVTGLNVLDKASQLAFGWSPEATSTKAGDHQWFTTPIIEVSNEKYKWMEQNWFVSQGHWEIPGDGTEHAVHDVYKLVAG